MYFTVVRGRYEMQCVALINEQYVMYVRLHVTLDGGVCQHQDIHENISRTVLLKSYLKALTIMVLSILSKKPTFIIDFNACYYRLEEPISQSAR